MKTRNVITIIAMLVAVAKNIFWQVASTVSVGSTSYFEEIILSETGVTFKIGASMNGRALAQTAVTLDSNAITKRHNRNFNETAERRFLFI